MLPPPVHRPIMLDEVLRCLRPLPGDLAIDCTLGGGGHAEAILERIRPGGRLIGIDLDPSDLPRTEARLRAAGFGAHEFGVRTATFASLGALIDAGDVQPADVVLVDLGISALQRDSPTRGFSHKVPGPLDMRMDQSSGETAWQLIERLDDAALARLLIGYADEPHAAVIARAVKSRPVRTTDGLERIVRTGLTAALPLLPKPEVRMSVRRTFQALRIAVNDEAAALDALLEALPRALRPGGRAAVLTFHSGEDRRVKKAFQEGLRAGVYAEIARRVIRSRKAETFADRRAAAAKLRWAIRAIS